MSAALRPTEIAALRPAPPGWPEDVPLPLTEDELPYDDGEPMESTRHRAQMNLLIAALAWHYRDQDDMMVEGNLGLYYSMPQALRQDFRAPDVMVVRGVARRPRKSFVVWQEERVPEVVIEILSAKTEREDRGRKFQIYEQVIQVPDYVLFDPATNRVEAWKLARNGSRTYRRVRADREGNLECASLGLKLGVVECEWEGIYDHWLRWKDASGAVLPTSSEAAAARADAERERANAERERADTEQARANAEQERADAEQERADAERERADTERSRAEKLEALLRAAGIDVPG